MRKGLRSSARKEQEVQSKLEERTRLRDRSIELYEESERDKETLNKQIEELCSKDNPEQSSSEESVVGAGDESDAEESLKVDPPQKFVSESSLVWDGQGDLQSPLKDTSDILDTYFPFSANQESLPPALSRGRSVSVSVNRADYSSLSTGEILELHPVCRDLNRRFEVEDPGPGSSVELISQDSFLDRNLQAKQAEVFDLIEEDLETNEVSVEVVNAEDNIRSKMDAEIYKGHVAKLRNDSRKVRRKIDKYTSEHVHIADAVDYKITLKEVWNVYEKVEEDLDKVIDELDPESEVERIGELEDIMRELKKAIMKNEKEVKDKMTELINEAAATKPRSTEEVKREEEATLKLQKKIGFLKEEAVENKNMILKLKKASDMTDNEIRKKLVDSKAWEKKAADLRKTREHIEAESTCLNIEAKEIFDMNTIVQECLDALRAKIENLEHEDEKRGLFTSINKNISRENVSFPENFSGEFGENVFRFKEKFLQALLDSQVREKDKVDTLRKHLSGQAKTLIGDHYTDIDKAMSSLIDYFGNSDSIWSRSKERFEKFFAGNPQKIWGWDGEERRIMAISKVIEFLREAIELAEKYDELKGVPFINLEIGYQCFAQILLQAIY